MPENEERIEIDDEAIAAWKVRLAELEQAYSALSDEINHVKYMIDAAERITDLWRGLAKTIAAKPGEPEYVGPKYDF